MAKVTERISLVIDEQKKAEEEKASKNILHKVKKALKEAFLMLPREEYNWLDISQKIKKSLNNEQGTGGIPGKNINEDDYAISDTYSELSEDDTGERVTEEQKEFFEYPGPLFKVLASPASAIVRVNEKKNLRCIARDKNRRQIDSDIDITWQIKDGSGTIDNIKSEFIEYTAPDEPGIAVLEATVIQDDIVCYAETIITVTEELIPRKDNKDGLSSRKGLPGYTFQKAPGELWRSKYDPERYIVIINNGHADFIYASKNKSRKLRYILRLFTKELVLDNFPEVSREELLERMIELNLYTEENLK